MSSIEASDGTSSTRPNNNGQLNSDEIHLPREIEELKNLSDEYENILKLFGIELCDLPDDCIELLNKYANIQAETNLHELSQTYLEELYYIKKREQMEQQTQINLIRKNINTLTTKIEKEENEIQNLQDFAKSVSEIVVSGSELEKNKELAEKKIEGIQDKYNKIEIMEDHNIDQLIENVELLEKKDKGRK